MVILGRQVFISIEILVQNMKHWSILIMSLLIILTGIIPFVLYVLIFIQYLVLVLDTSNWIEISVGVIFLESIWVGALLFFIEGHGKEKHEKRDKLSKHWHELRIHVLEKWVSLQPIGTRHIEGLRPALKDDYLNSSSIFGVETTWHKLTMQHICDKQGYPAVCGMIEHLKTYEKDHNVFVAILLGTLDDEIESLLEKLSNLKEYTIGMKNDFYFMKNIRYALHNPETSLNIFADGLYVDSDMRIAKSDSETLQKLKDGIEKIRTTHKNAFEKIENSIVEDRKILTYIGKQVNDAIYDLSLEKPLKGQCDYERSLDE